MIVPTDIRLYGMAPDSIVDGPGLRYAVFLQGCSHGCPGCHNVASQAPDGGYVESIDKVMADIQANGLVHDVTISGGEPFEQPAAAAELAARCKACGYGVWTYTGYLYEDLLRMAEGTAGEKEAAEAAAGQTEADRCAPSDESATDGEDARVGEGAPAEWAAAIARLLANTDVLVDGPFVQAKKSLGLQWRGSSNQRLIDLAATRREGRVVLWEQRETFPAKPASW